MKITYNKNPLLTTIELDEQEKEMFRLKIRIKELEDDMGSAAVFLDPKNASWAMAPSPGRKRPEPHTLETLIQQVLKDHLNMDYMWGEDDKPSGLDERVDMLLQHYLKELVSAHCGDCTCVACSCSKCHAESILGIDTIKGVGKHSLYKIDGAFGRNNEKSIDEAIDSLTNYKVSPPTDPAKIASWERSGGFERNVQRWTDEAKAARDWLTNYRETYFKDQS